MWKESQMIEYLRENLNEKRFNHSLSVRDEAVKLAKLYKVDEDKARLAGLLHDCAKNMSSEKIVLYLKERNCNLDEVSKKNPQLMHGMVASFIVCELMGIDDLDIINAIKYHTTGRRNMSKLEKIIYIADYTEPLRNYDGVEDLRVLAYKDLDKALLYSFEHTISYVLQNKGLLHLDTIEGRNFIIENCR